MAIKLKLCSTFIAPAQYVCESTPLKRHNAKAKVQCSHQHAFSIIQGNLPCLASEIRFGLAHRSVGSSRNGLSAPRAAAIDPRKTWNDQFVPRVDMHLQPLLPPSPRRHIILNVCYFDAAGEYEICALEIKSIRWCPFIILLDM
jgi:hypothetical protein